MVNFTGKDARFYDKPKIGDSTESFLESTDLEYSKFLISFFEAP